MLNKVFLIGRLTQDPQMRYTSSGTPVTNFRLAIDRRFTNQQGERETDFIDIVAWRKLAELCADYLVKGQKAAVDGRIQVRSYEVQSGENQGQRRTVFEVVADSVEFLEKPGGSGGGQRASKQQDEPQSDFSPDDVPF